jgi:hypothetical protein
MWIDSKSKGFTLWQYIEKTVENENKNNLEYILDILNIITAEAKKEAYQYYNHNIPAKHQILKDLTKELFENGNYKENVIKKRIAKGYYQEKFRNEKSTKRTKRNKRNDKQSEDSQTRKKQKTTNET